MATTTSPSAPPGVAHILRAARERRGESIEEASETTRISTEYLDALERDAPLSAFPAPVYARFFLRQYARHLQLDEDAVVAAHAARHGGGQPDLPRGVRPAPAQALRSGPWLSRAAAASRSLSSRTVDAITAVSPRPRRWRRSRRPAQWSSRPPARRRWPVLLTVTAALALVAGAAAAPYLLTRDREATGGLDEGDAQVAATRPEELPRGGTLIFPEFRVVAFYGAPHDDDLGVLGIGPEPAARRLLQQANGYTFSPRPVLPAFELIGTLAMREPGPDQMHRVRMSDSDIREYLFAARDVRALFVIDVQPGRADFLTEVKVYEDLLREPDVGLALDPEWHVGPEQVPGEVLGSVDAATVNRVIDYLSALVRKYDLPQKLLVIHQFTKEMIQNKAKVFSSTDEVAVTFDIDGFGDRPNKIDKYETFSQQFERRFHHGFKVFYQQDVNVMTPLDVLGLRPTPDLVVYQ